MWGWLLADVALKAMGVDWGRLVRAVHLLGQVRLLRTYGFVVPTSDADAWSSDFGQI